MEFEYDGGGLGKGGTVTLFIDGTQAGQGRVEATVPMIFSADETTDLGIDYASPVAEDYPGDSSFTGDIKWVRLDLTGDNHEHMITPEEKMKVAMARQ
jgi:arylsulfatase